MRVADLPNGVLVFVAQGCSACAAFKPHLEAIAGRWAECIPTYVLDVAQHGRLADAMGVRYTPTTVLSRRGRAAARLDGTVAPHEIDAFYAAAVQSCPVQPLPAPADAGEAPPEH
jgi:thiol-disulfide isomerase/thioredoxin